jgi:hypothetical protein
MHSNMKLTIVGSLFVAGLVSCARQVSTGTSTPASTPTPTPATTAPRNWPVLTRSHVDLWLHGYAMLLRDSARVPVFRRGYRDRVQAARTQRNVTTLLDANRDRLQQRLTINPGLANGQFAPLYFASFQQMQDVIRLFLQAEGNVNATNDNTLRQYFAVLGSSYATPADREWLRIFTESLEDERRRFYQEYWTAEHSARLSLVRAADSLWQATYRAKLQRFLNNTQQENGEIILALTLGGEGRTVNFSSRQNAVAATMPEQDPREALYVFAHEIVGSIVTTAVNDNTTPADQRAGVAANHVLMGAVRGGAMLLQKAAPELAEGYMRYYLQQAGVATTGDISARLAATFPVPELVRAAIERQLEVVLGGI